MSTEHGPLRRCWQWVRRRPIRSALMGIVLFVVLVPVWPYQPHCGVYSSAGFGALKGEMTPDYLAAIDAGLSQYDVYHLRIGNRIFVRLLVALDASGGFDLHGSMLSAQTQAVASLVSPLNIYSLVGKELEGRIYEPPAYLKALYESNESLVFGEDCTFIRAVAFGELPPPDYAPEPSTTESLPPDPRSDVD